MSDDLDLDAVMAAAEQAAGSGDFAAAERHLVDAARLQEQALGPAHPDLANTLNNLGVVYERTGRTDDAGGDVGGDERRPGDLIDRQHGQVTDVSQRVDDDDRQRAEDDG